MRPNDACLLGRIQLRFTHQNFGAIMQRSSVATNPSTDGFWSGNVLRSLKELTEFFSETFYFSFVCRIKKSISLIPNLVEILFPTIKMTSEPP